MQERIERHQKTKRHESRSLSLSSRTFGSYGTIVWSLSAQGSGTGCRQNLSGWRTGCLNQVPGIYMFQGSGHSRRLLGEAGAGFHQSSSMWRAASGAVMFRDVGGGRGSLFVFYLFYFCFFHRAQLGGFFGCIWNSCAGAATSSLSSSFKLLE